MKMDKAKVKSNVELRPQRLVVKWWLDQIWIRQIYDEKEHISCEISEIITLLVIYRINVTKIVVVDCEFVKDQWVDMVHEFTVYFSLLIIPSKEAAWTTSQFPPPLDDEFCIKCVSIRDPLAHM